jgi:AcrR family transcriptional regulator/predicted DNA-binding transcriptional regulator AlpA
MVQMKIGRLSKVSGLSRSTIHHYMNVGILHKPSKTGLNLFVYDESHLERLRQIRELKEKQRLSLIEIREVLKDEALAEKAPQLQAPDRAELEAGLSFIEEKKERESTREKREMILDAAIALFSEKGYENTKISDITDRMKMGKGTFYIYFKNKEELFLECIDRLTTVIVPREAWDEIRNEQDPRAKGYKRTTAFLNAFPGFRGILNLLRVALGGDDPRQAQKAKETYKLLCAPMERAIQSRIDAGDIPPDCDKELLAFISLVVAEGLGYWQMINPSYTVQDLSHIPSDAIERLFSRPETEQLEADENPQCPCEVRDRQGVTVELRSTRLGDRPFLPGKMGNATVEIELDRISEVGFREHNALIQADVTLKDGQAMTVEMEGRLLITGETHFGSYKAPIEGISHISFREQ